MQTSYLPLTEEQVKALQKENEALRDLLEEGKKVVTQGKPIFDLIGNLEEGNLGLLTLKLPKIIYAVQKDKLLIHNVTKFLEKIKNYDNSGKI